MNGNTESSSVPPEAVQPETDFAEFFHGVISKLYDLKNRQILNDVKTALRNIRHLKNETVNFNKKAYFSFKPPQVRCAYFYAYGVLHSIMVYSEFSKLLKQSKMFLIPACRRDCLKICCLGGGPGIEAVAICRSINDIIMEPCLSDYNSLLEVHVTIVDKLPHWRREESTVVNAINDSSNVLHSGRIILHSDFMRADLLKPFENSLKDKIMEADIVTAVKVAVSIQENSSESCEEDLQLMMENIIESMREDSCLFMLDAAGGQVFNNMVRFLRGKGSHSRLKTSLHKGYNLDGRTVKKFEEMMKLKKDPNYRPVLPTAKGKVSSCMWVKNITIFPDFNNIGKILSFTNPVCSPVESVKDAASHSSSDLETSNDDAMATTDTSKSTEPEKKSKRAKKKAMKRKSNKGL